MTLDSRSMELIRRQTLEKAATDLRRAAEAMARDVEEARSNVALVRAWLVVVDQVGWPTGND